MMYLYWRLHLFASFNAGFVEYRHLCSFKIKKSYFCLEYKTIFMDDYIAYYIKYIPHKSQIDLDQHYKI